MPTNSVVALLGFNLAYMTDISTTTVLYHDELITTLEDYLTDGMLEEFLKRCGCHVARAIASTTIAPVSG
jgi:hypothetical protein